MASEWLIAGAVLVSALALLPALLRRTRRIQHKPGAKNGGSGVTIAIGMVFAMIFDPKAVIATEQIQKRSEMGEDEDSGDRPGAGGPD